MENQQNEKVAKKPLNHERIYKIMGTVPMVVAFLFFIKNVIGKNMVGALTIGISLVVLEAMKLFMKAKNVEPDKKEFILSMALPLLIFTISLNSGASYSDDFPMYLAVVGLGGLYLEPRITKFQVIISDILFVLMYIIHPEKAESLGQYILCLVVFTLAAWLFSLTINRGRAFIEISDERAKEAEKLLESMRQMGVDLQNDFTSSNAQIEGNTKALKRGSQSITQGANDVSDRCIEVHDKIAETEGQISQLNAEVKSFESALEENQCNVEAMNEQVQAVSDMITEANVVFKEMEEQMNEIASIAKQLSNISFNTTILSLNASIESARAGDAGSGFAVVAGRMRELSENSDMFSEQVGEVVKELLEQVERTSKKFAGSTQAMEQSRQTMEDLQAGFEQLQAQFSTLYNNIEQQNQNVKQVDYIFEGLQHKVSEMHSYSVDNQEAVESIVEAMDNYKGNISKVIESTKNV